MTYDDPFIVHPFLPSLRTHTPCTMKTPSPTSWLCYLLFIFVVFYGCCTSTSFAAGQCLDDQKSILLELRDTLNFKRPVPSRKLSGWNASIDCCLWSGVSCDPSTGDVIGLDLDYEGFWGGIDDSSNLFQLHSLRRLSLAYNYDIPSALGKLSNLTFLDLSYAGSLWQIKCPNLATIIQNLTNLSQLHLDGVYISANGKDWWDSLSTSVPQLQILSMQNCNLTGEIPQSVAKLRALSVIILDGNKLSGPVPEFFATFKNLTTLRLNGCGFVGTFPREIFQMPALTVVDLSYNSMLQGTLPEFPQNGSLEVLQLHITNFSGLLPNSIGTLRRLRILDLSNCHFNGIIPSSIASLSELEYLDLSFGNNFSGPIPSFTLMKNMTRLHLSSNSLNGSISFTNWGNLQNLSSLRLENNSLSGNIPTSLFSSTSLEEVDMSDNNFSGQLNEFESLMLKTLHLRSNNLEGPVPKSLFLLRSLETLDLAGNKFNGTLELGEILYLLPNLTTLDLSDNILLVNAHGNDTTRNASFPLVSILRLRSCNLDVVPEFLRTQAHYLIELDLSRNNIPGTVPKWIWNIGNQYSTLNLSYNNFEDLEDPIPYAPKLLVLDLHSNNLQGELPSVPSPNGAVIHLDWSNNSFTSMSPRFGCNLPSLVYLSIAKNKIYGRIPHSLCNSTMLDVLDLGDNHLQGSIPHYLITMSQNLGVLNLRRNSLTGTIPDEFGKGCTLETLNFNGNFLRGQIPRSLTNCKQMKVLDLGNNGLDDTFPCELKTVSKLQVLILRSNKFSRNVACLGKDPIWPSLQILDLASNHFSGEIAAQFNLEWRMMMTGTKKQSTSDHLQYYSRATTGYYQDAIRVTFKGNELELQKILTIFTSIDLSDNAFHGEVPKELGNLNALIVLNLSHNTLSGNIPKSLGNLSQLESLDLSCNALGGNIPRELADLDFLEYLNLSFNKLTGRIPTSTQLQSFDASSYLGNLGLYGPPLTRINPPRPTPPTSMDGSQRGSESTVQMMLRGAEVGFPVGLTIFIGPLLYIKRWRTWYCKHLGGFLMKILGREVQANGRIRRKRSRRQQQQQRQ